MARVSSPVCRPVQRLLELGVGSRAFFLRLLPGLLGGVDERSQSRYPFSAVGGVVELSEDLGGALLERHLRPGGARLGHTPHQGLALLGHGDLVHPPELGGPRVGGDQAVFDEDLDGGTGPLVVVSGAAPAVLQVRPAQ
ncbi:hypothetical protein ACIRPX_29300 [Streptomyces sp. NPDC101225]|uniref:hypothetical protein n=1 Tax=Streptomyces sp. NPDC101225 TaxID=3366135 RepID=UPI00380F1598